MGDLTTADPMKASRAKRLELVGGRASNHHLNNRA